MTCECGDTHRDPCPRCERAIDHHQHDLDHDDDRAAENRHDTYLLGAA